MIEFTNTQRPPFTVLDAMKGDGLSPEAAGRILRRVMASIRAHHALECARVAQFEAARVAEGAELAACGICGLTPNAECGGCA